MNRLFSKSYVNPKPIIKRIFYESASTEVYFQSILPVNDNFDRFTGHTNKMEKLKGLIAAPFTPLHPNGDVNLEMIDVLAESLAENQVTGAFVCGSTGEGAALTLYEKKQVIAQWGKVASKRLKIMALVGGTSVREAQELALRAKEHHLYAISLVAPYYFKPANVVQLVDFCAEVVSAVPDMPFYYYHIPALTGVNFPMIHFLREAEGKIPTLAGIKYTDENLMDFSACLNFRNKKYDLLWGRDEILLAALAMGAEGAVGSTYNYAAPLYHQVIDAFQYKDWRKAQSLQQNAISMISLFPKYHGNSIGKAIMRLIGLDCGGYRQPLGTLTEEEMLSLKSDLTKLDFFNFCSQPNSVTEY